MAHAQLIKPAAKTAPRVVRKHAHTPAAPAAMALKHFIVDFARPKHGGALAAHTQVFLDLSGIAAGRAYPKAKAVQVIGSTAVKYHLGKENLEATTEGLKLTDKGYAFFSARDTVDPELVKAFTEVLTKGVLNDRANVKTPISVGLIK